MDFPTSRFATCSLSIMVARTDIPFMMHTIPHLVRMCNYDFLQRVLVVDTAPLTGDKVNRPGIGTMEQLRANCQQLLAMGVVDRIIEIDYSESYRDRIYRKHFGTRIRQTHNYKGYPILGTLFSLEEVPGDYVLHFDSDMLLYQAPDYDWITEGMRLMEQHPEVMSIRPLTGPPTEDGMLHQSKDHQLDPSGFYRFKFFSSRAYLIKRQRFDELLPLDILWRPAKNPVFDRLPNPMRTLLNYHRQGGALDSWEVMVSNRLEETAYVRATLSSPQAWTVHPIDRGPAFIENLPTMIEQIERGWYPKAQAGHYDLQLQHWLGALVA